MIPGALHDCCHCGEGIHSPSPWRFGGEYYRPECRDELFTECVECFKLFEADLGYGDLCETCREREETENAE